MEIPLVHIKYCKMNYLTTSLSYCIYCICWVILTLERFILVSRISSYSNSTILFRYHIHLYFLFAFSINDWHTNRPGVLSPKPNIPVLLILTAGLCIKESNTGFDVMLTSAAVFILKHIFHLLLFYVQLSRVTVFCDTLMPFSSRAGSTSSYISRVTGMTTPFSVILPTKETTNIFNDENKKENVHFTHLFGTY